MVGTINDVVNFRKPACRSEQENKRQKNPLLLTRREPEVKPLFCVGSEACVSRWWFAVGVVDGSQV
jgi:hypothetical protein